MKMHQALFTKVGLPLAAAIAGGAVWWGGGEPAHAADPWRSTVVAVRGTVSGQPESVVFSGNAKINSRLARDPDFNKPKLLFSIDLTGVTGVGSVTGKQYAIPSTELVQRRLAPSHVVEITFPFVEAGIAGRASARTGVASFGLEINTSTGAVITATTSVVGPFVVR